MKYKGLLATLLITLGINACSTRSPKANFYLLQNEFSSTELSGSLRVGLGPVTVADYLNKPQIAIRTDTSKIRFSEFERWASDLRGLIINALQHDLAEQLGSDNIFEYPWRKSDDVDFAVILDIKRFDASFIEMSAYLEAKVKLIHGDGTSSVQSYSLTESFQEPSFENAVSAERRLLKQLSSKIASLIEQQ